MTAANDDVDEEALLYGDVGACATTTATNGENSTRALNFEPARWIALRRARRDDPSVGRVTIWIDRGRPFIGLGVVARLLAYDFPVGVHARVVAPR